MKDYLEKCLLDFEGKKEKALNDILNSPIYNILPKTIKRLEECYLLIDTIPHPKGYKEEDFSDNLSTFREPLFWAFHFEQELDKAKYSLQNDTGDAFSEQCQAQVMYDRFRNTFNIAKRSFKGGYNKKGQFKRDIPEVLEYKKTHTFKATSEKFGISEDTIQNYITRKC